MKIHTLRGTFVPGETKRLVLDDGNFNLGFIVRRFIVAGDPRDATDDAYATLGTQYDAPLVWNWGDNRQIAWSASHIRASNSIDAPFELIDRDHMVLADLWIQGGSNSPYINYYVELEQVVIGDDQAILTLIKERSQDDIR